MFHLWVVVPNLDRPLQDRRVLRVEPLEEHHVRDLGVKCERDAAEVAGEADHGLADLEC